MYQIRLSRRAEKDLVRIPIAHRILIERALKRFAEYPDLRHDVVKIRDSPKVAPRYRIRIGEYRATFFIYHDILLIEIITIGKMENFECRPFPKNFIPASQSAYAFFYWGNAIFPYPFSDTMSEFIPADQKDQITCLPIYPGRIKGAGFFILSAKAFAGFLPGFGGSFFNYCVSDWPF